MKLIALSQVIVEKDRQRQEFTQRSLETLADSISRLGLIHAILLEPDGRTLRAGERRFRAVGTIKTPYKHDGGEVPPGFVPFTTTADLSEAELYELELEENIQREDITWQERTAAYGRLFELQEKINGTPLTVAEFGRTLNPENPVNAMMAARKHLLLVDHLADPDVAGAKTMKEAENIVRRKNEGLLREELLTRIGVQESKHRLVNMDVFTFAPTLPANSVDIIITDPPYGIDMHEMTPQSNSNAAHSHDYNDSEEYAEQCVKLIAWEGARICKASSVCYMFCDIRMWSRWGTYFEPAGWYVWPNPIIWNKAPVGSLLGSANGPRHTYECILMAIKGGKTVNTVGEDVINISGPMGAKRHPAEKPVSIYEKLLSWSAAPGDTVLDLFCGCGPIFPAADVYGCIAVGCEKDTAYYNIAALRMNNVGKEIL